MRIECEQCGKNVLGKVGYQIDQGRIGIAGDGAGMPNDISQPNSVKGDGMFCSLKCVGERAS
jgi:hypothetical protein